MTPREELQAAVDRAGWRCRFCGSAEITVESRGGWVLPVTGHFVKTLATACPSMRGGMHARLVSDDLWALLDRYLGPPADYGDDTELAVINDELAAL